MSLNSSDDDSSGDETIKIDPAWRSKIGFADWVDFLDEKKSTWSRAQIVEENQPEFKFKILREGELDYHAEWVGIFSDRIAPQNTKTRAAQKKLRKFQKRLKVGDEVDARTDVNRTWYSGTVIEFRTNDQNVEEVKVRFNSHIIDSWVPRYGLQSAPPHAY